MTQRQRSPEVATHEPAGTTLPRCIGRLHVITTETLQTRYSHVEIAALAAQGGADVVQFREKRNQNTQTQLLAINEMQSALHSKKCQLIVNDRSDLAHATKAGLHIGPNDISPMIARDILGPEPIIGATANNPEMLAALQDAPIDYVGVGPVFETNSKDSPAPTLGLEGLRRMIAESPFPVIAIGSIRAHQVQSVLQTGAHGVAVISGVVLQDNPAAAAHTYRHAIDAFLKSDASS